MRTVLSRLGAAAALAVAALGTGSLTPAQATPPGLLPLTVTNNSGRGDQVFLYLTGILNGHLGYVDGAGHFTAWPPGANPPSPAPDTSIPGPGNGASRTLQLPLGLAGGRMYMSYGQKLKFFLTPDGLVQPAPWAAGDANRDILFDWSEFTYDGGGLYLNSSQVDMFAVPHEVAVTSNSGATQHEGLLKPGGRGAVFAGLKSQPGDWSKLIYTRSDGTILRAISPRKAIESGLFGASYFNGYVQSAWNTYKNTTLTVVPYADSPNAKFLGHTDSSGTLQFTNTSGAQVASFSPPSTSDVFGCDGRLAAPNNDVGAIARTLCAALHRSTLGYLNTQPTTDPSQFYTRDVTDHYSQQIHAQMTDGKAYGFAFDDVGHFESLVHEGDPRSAQITLTPLN